MINNFKLTLVILLLTIASNIYAQKTIYQGNYKIEGIGQGYAKFDYQIKKKDTLFTGSFEFSKYFDEKDKRTISYKGNFDEDQLNGKWEFSNKKIDSIGQQKSTDFNLLSLTSGKEFQLSAYFKNDQQTDKWSLIKRNYINSEPKDTTFQSSITFDDNHIKRSFEASDPKFDVEAGFNKAGFLDGKFIIKHYKQETELTEIRVYSDGALEKHYFQIKDQKVFIDYLGFDQTKDEDEETWVDLPLGKEYNDVLELANISTYQFDYIDGQLNVLSNRSSAFIVEALEEFYVYNTIDIWQPFHQNGELRNNAEVSLRKYPLSSQEKKAIQQIKDDFESISYTIDDFKDNKLAEIGIYQNRKLNETVQIFDLIESKKDQLKENVDILSSSAITYLDRSRFDNRIFSDVNFPENIKFDFQDKSVEEKTNLPASFEVDDFKISDYATYINTIKVRVDQLNQSSKKIINDLLKQSRLNKIEEELITKRDSIFKLYKKEFNEEKFNTYHQQTAESIIDFIQKEFQNYATLSLDEKKENIDQYLTCFDDVLSLYQMQKELPDKIDRLENLYTRTVWNPYTYSDMDEIVKERIYDAYQEILLPFILNQIKSEINCEQIPINRDNFKKLYDRMVEIREIDTKDLEKEIKKVKDPEIIFEILSIKYTK